MKVGQVLFDRYEVLKYINSGGTGEIYLVKHLPLKANMAMKVVDKAEAISQEYINEANTLKMLRHPQLPRVIDIFETDEKLCIIRDFIDGETLEEHVDRYGPMTYEAVIAATKELLEVLGYLHKQPQPIIYRDLKPSNIIVVDGEAMSLIDFGTTRTFVPGKTMDTISLGTQGYAAPEQYGGNQSDARTDIYGLGAVMYFMYTGEHFCDVESALKYNKFSSTNGQKLLKMIQKSMAIMQEDRYQDADSMLKELSPTKSAETEVLLGAQEISAETIIRDKISVGIMGLTRGVGVTQIAMMIAAITREHYGKVCYFEKERTDALSMFERYLDDNDIDAHTTNSQYKHKGISFINSDDADLYQKILTSQDVSMVLDYANHHYLIHDFLRNHYKFFVLPSSAWAIKNADIIHTIKTYQDVLFIINLADDLAAKQIQTWLDLPKKRVVNIGFVRDVFSVDEEHLKIHTSLGLGATQKKKKHKLFGVF